MRMRTMNMASDGFRPREAGPGDAAGKRAVLIQALILSRRLRARARLAGRAAVGRDAMKRDTAPPDAPLMGMAVPDAAHADVPGPGR